MSEFSDNPPILNLEVIDYEDTHGEPALWVTVIIPEEADVDKWQGRDISRMKFLMREKLRNEGIDLFPYISIAKPSDLEDDSE